MAIYSGFSHEKWWFSIAMLNYQRVTSLPFPTSSFYISRWTGWTSPEISTEQPNCAKKGNQGGGQDMHHQASGTQVHGCTTSPNRESHGPIHLSYSRSDLCIQLRFGDQYLDTPGLEIWRPSILRPLYPMNGLTPENYTLMKIQGPLTYDKGLYLDHCTTDNRHINYIALSYSLTVVRSVVFLVFFWMGGASPFFKISGGDAEATGM